VRRGGGRNSRVRSGPGDARLSAAASPGRACLANQRGNDHLARDSLPAPFGIPPASRPARRPIHPPPDPLHPPPPANYLAPPYLSRTFPGQPKNTIVCGPISSHFAHSAKNSALPRPIPPRILREIILAFPLDKPSPSRKDGSSMLRIRSNSKVGIPHGRHPRPDTAGWTPAPQQGQSPCGNLLDRGPRTKTRRVAILSAKAGTIGPWARLFRPPARAGSAQRALPGLASLGRPHTF